MHSIEVNEQDSLIRSLSQLRLQALAGLAELKRAAPTKAPYSLHNAIIEQLNHTIEVESSILLRYQLG